MSHKYETLIKILDSLSREAPKSYKKYHPSQSDSDGVGKSRSLSFIHLLLKVKFGVTSFLDRHQLITDGTQDGGLDAYFIDHENKKLYLIQSKFRQTSKNFEEKSIAAEDLITMDISKITKGIEKDSRGIAFNSKINVFQEKLRDIRDIARYEYIVLFLGNVYKFTDDQLRKAVENNIYEVIDGEKAYTELIFPLTTGTYYDPDEIIIKLDLSKKERPRLNQEIITDFGNFEVMVIFVPTAEIGRVLSKYKNAILKFNPRNFLSLRKGGTNEKIKKSITDQENNNFAILNNGITLLSETYKISEETGRQNEGQLILTKPQILNGGQTAFTLSEIYNEFKDSSNNPLIGKEVLLKIITPLSGKENIDYKFIELISNATNQQNEVSEADRRSNHSIQIELQKNIFNHYGYFYERKSGEFYDGIHDKIIDEKILINRLKFIKAYLAYLGEPAAARRTSETVLFREDRFYDVLHETDKFSEMFFAYLLFAKLEEIEKSFRKKDDSIKQYGYSLMYGKWAVVASIGLQKPKIVDDKGELFNQVNDLIIHSLEQWKKFDTFIRNKHKKTKYFSNEKSNFELYYKINLLDDDIKEFFLK